MRLLQLARGETLRRASNHEERELRLDSLRRLVDAFVHDLALLLAGHTTRFEHTATPEVADRLRFAVAPFLENGEVLRIDFGTFAELRIDGNLDDASSVRALLEFDDRCLRQRAHGRALGSAKRRVRLILNIDQSAHLIDDCSVAITQ